MKVVLFALCIHQSAYGQKVGLVENSKNKFTSANKRNQNQC